MFMFTRRNFLVKAAASLAGIVSIPLLTRWVQAIEKSTAAQRVVEVTASDISQATIEKMVSIGLNEMGGLGSFVKKGMRVVVKPNIGFANEPQYATTTNPDLVEAVARRCIALGAEVTIFDRTCNNRRICYERSGMNRAAKNSGADIQYINSRKFKTVTVKNGLNLTKLEVYRDVLEADVVINMPIAKDHSSATLTLAMKNLMGVIGGNRGLFHINLHKNIVDFNKAIPVHLNILDATRILTDHGPNSGRLSDVREKRIIVMGTTAATVDAYAAQTFFNMKPASIGYLRYAAQEKMGEINPRNIRVVKKRV
jgi:uncharacterized protein (DUF362 family)